MHINTFPTRDVHSTHIEHSRHKLIHLPGADKQNENLIKTRRGGSTCTVNLPKKPFSEKKKQKNAQFMFTTNTKHFIFSKKPLNFINNHSNYHFAMSDGSRFIAE